MMGSSFVTLSFERLHEHVGLLILDRPEAANAINTQMAGELLTFFSELIAAPQQLRCLILTGCGDKAFCAGGDLKERDSMSDEEWLAQHALIERTIVAMLECPMPVIAAVNGAAFGGGCELALAADFAYAAETARFALTETRLGIIPGGGGTQTLPRAVGTRRALEMICTAREFNAEEAQAWGIANRVLPRKQLLREALATAQQIAMNAPLAVRQAKRSVRIGAQMNIHHGLEFALEAYKRLIGTADRREGVRSFIEKRQPQFVGR